MCCWKAVGLYPMRLSNKDHTTSGLLTTLVLILADRIRPPVKTSANDMHTGAARERHILKAMLRHYGWSEVLQEAECILCITERRSVLTCCGRVVSRCSGDLRNFGRHSPVFALYQFFPQPHRQPKAMSHVALNPKLEKQRDTATPFTNLRMSAQPALQRTVRTQPSCKCK